MDRIEQRDPHGFMSDLAETSFLHESEAADLARDFVETLAEFVDRDVWNAVASVVPVDISIDWDEIDDRAESTVEEFLLAMSAEEDVETGRSADHARAVAETVERYAGPDELDRIGRMRNEGILSLFETTRGQLTSPEAPTRGVQQRTDP